MFLVFLPYCVFLDVCAEVARVCGMDPRIGPYFLNSSVGFGGSCFGKDLQGLVYLCESYNLKEVAEYWRQVYTKLHFVVMHYRSSRSTIIKRIVLAELWSRVCSEMLNTKMHVSVFAFHLTNFQICVLGFSFKKDTGDFRDSAALDVIAFLLKEQANVYLYDPKVLQQRVPLLIISQVPYEEINKIFPEVKCQKTPYAAAHNTMGIAILTEWDEFKVL